MEQRDILEQCGRALFGNFDWKSNLAAGLEVAPRTFRRWMAQTEDMPDGVYNDLLKLMCERKLQLMAAINLIAKII